jgi:hypothetical protein
MACVISSQSFNFSELQIFSSVETRGGGKKMVNDDEVCHIWIGTRHNEADWKPVEQAGYGKGEELQWKGLGWL